MIEKARRFPAEWEPQEGIILCFPHNGRDWPGKYAAVQWAFVEYIKKIALFEKVFLLVNNGEHRKRVGELLAKADVDLSMINFIVCRTNRSWMRDSGPIIVSSDGRREGLQFKFNGWSKYPNYHLDKKVPATITEHLQIPLQKVVYKGKPFVLEGGAIDVNGKGTLITTEECLLDQATQVRNPGLTKADYEAVFMEYLGITNTIWLDKGISGDDTHGHVDDLCRFVNASTLVTVVETKKGSADYIVLQENLKRLKNANLETGKRPDIVTLPMPKPILFEGIHLPASYANFLIINGAVLVPVFNDKNDRLALNILSECFPDREIIGIGAIDLIWGFGTLHCLSQQVPSNGSL